MGEYADAIINRMIDGGQYRAPHRVRKLPAPTCPKCRKPATRSETQYGPRYDCCGLTAWGASAMADSRTRRAKSAAHVAFDPLWTRGKISRGEAYRRLALRMGLHPTRCHISLMDYEQADSVPAHCRAIWRDLMAEK